jgi:hypothetical protein
MTEDAKFVAKVRTMRVYQKMFFQTLEPHFLALSKQFEKEVDECCDVFTLTGHFPQNLL